jgi:prolipoprotein diacylglyceryl transferase
MVDVSSCVSSALVTAFIPSPSFNVLHLGPLQIRLYGLMIALGALTAVSLANRRWQQRGGGPSDISAVAMWAIPAGVIGARAYHVATDWKTYRGNWLNALAIWHGGLGIPGGVAAGVLVGIIVARRRHLPPARLLDVVAPALPIAQAIGRLGNWFNQEVFGRPSTMPWALKIGPAHRPAGYERFATFHPTFLYEGLWNLALAAVLILLERRRRLRRGELFNLYVLGYAVGRLWVEDLRSDHASLIFGIRINLWISSIVILAAAAVFIIRRLRSNDRPVSETAEPVLTPSRPRD